MLGSGENRQPPDDSLQERHPLAYLASLAAVREFRHQQLLQEAAHERLAAAAIAASFERESAMFGEGHHDSIVQPGIEEALACQDVLQRDPPSSSLLARSRAWLVAIVRAFARHKRPEAPHAVSPASNVTLAQ
jgi:hypothetical protein